MQTRRPGHLCPFFPPARLSSTGKSPLTLNRAGGRQVQLGGQRILGPSGSASIGKVVRTSALAQALAMGACDIFDEEASARALVPLKHPHVPEGFIAARTLNY